MSTLGFQLPWGAGEAWTRGQTDPALDLGSAIPQPTNCGCGLDWQTASPDTDRLSYTPVYLALEKDTRQRHRVFISSRDSAASALSLRGLCWASSDKSQTLWVTLRHNSFSSVSCQPFLGFCSPRSKACLPAHRSSSPGAVPRHEQAHRTLPWETQIIPRQAVLMLTLHSQ